jgi:hypothetical protein
VPLKKARSDYRRAPKTQFLADANIEPWGIYVMRYRHFDIMQADRAGIRYHDDKAVFARAWSLRRVLVTHDTDFLDDRLFPFSRCSGLLVVPTYGRVSMVFANLLAGACELVAKGGTMWFHTKIEAMRDFTVKVRTWEKREGRTVSWEYRIPAGYCRAGLGTR